MAPRCSTPHHFFISILLGYLAFLWSCSFVSCFVPEQQQRQLARIPHCGTRLSPAITTTSPATRITTLASSNSRENEIRRKISELKRDGKIANKPSQPTESSRPSATPVNEQYGGKIRQKLGARKGRLLGITSTTDNGDEEEELDPIQAELDAEEEAEQTTTTQPKREARLGALPQQPTDSDADASQYVPPSSSSSTKDYQNFNADLFDDGDEDEEADLSEEELIELVAAKLSEQRRVKREAEEAQREENARKRIEELEEERAEQQRQQASSGKTTTGIGGSWSKQNDTNVESYKPSKSGTWGVFDRPKDISTAFGGGKRVGAGYTPDELTKKQSEENTKDRLKQYREKVGIEVQSEKDHAAEIDQALAIGRRAMERGMYASAVTALEKVTRWCSTNSKVGGKVFLELAMAYEAVGRTQEAVTVYTTLTTCRIEDIKFNAKRLLYGIEAMQFMRNEAKSPEFQRNKIRNTFIDTTGLKDIASHFDDVYQTAYIDLDSGYYRRLTESVVRSNREARQILLKATGAGEVERLKIVQALRSISRHFDDALEEEIERNRPKPEPTAFINGKPIIATPEEDDDISRMMGGMDEFTLGSAEQMKENLNGEWRLQLLADKRGDGVKYYNTSLSWQTLNTESMTFESAGTAGFLSVTQSGGIKFKDKKRVLKRTNVDVSGTGGVLSGFFAKGSGAPGAVSTPHQVVMVDSVLLVTRMAPLKNKKYDDSTKEYFAVWRRVEPGTFSKRTRRSTSSSRPTSASTESQETSATL